MKHFSLNNAKWLIAPLITVAIIGLMWCYYVVVYVPNRVEYLSGRNLRILARIGKQITSTTESYNKRVLRNPRPADDPAQKPELQKYTIKHTFEGKGKDTKLNVTFIPKVSSLPPISRPVNFAPREFNIVLVVNHQGEVLFHQAPLGIQISGLGQLTGSSSVSSKHDEDKAENNQEAESNKKDGDKAEKNQKTEFNQAVILEVTEVREVTVAGQAYTMFLTPVQVPVQLEHRASSSVPVKERWVVAGLVKKSQFLSECKSFSYTLRSAAISLMIVMVVSIPLMRMLTVCQRERVRPLNIALLVYSLLMATALVTLFLADMFVHASAETRLNRQAIQLADQIAKNVSKEIQLAYLQLRGLTQQAKGAVERVVQQKPTVATKEKEENNPCTGKRSVNTSPEKEENILYTGKVSVNTSPYPFLNTAFWIDPCGIQRVKWTTQQETTPFIDLSDRPYFKQARDNRLLTVLFDMEEEPHEARLWVEPVFSRTSGEFVTFLAMPLSDAMLEGPVPEFEHWVAVLETKFLSLTNPVLPKGFEYVVINGDGKVLFNSDEGRNSRGSLIEETDHNRTIQSALAGHMDQEGEGVYWGQDQHIVVKPLGQVPWTLVVFRDKQLLHTAGAQRLATATILFLLYTLLLSALFTVGWLLGRLKTSSPGYRAAWLWPHPGKQRAYRHIIVFNLGMSLVLASFSLWGHGWKTVVVGTVIPLIAVGFAVVQWTRRRNSTPSVVNASRGLYHLTAASFVLVLSFLPAVAFFTVAYDVEHELFLKEGQLSLASGLVEQERRVRDDYQKIAFSSSNPEEEFFQSRLKIGPDEDRLDVYSRFFAGTKIEYADTVPSFQAESSWIEQQFLQLVELIRFPFNDGATKSSGLIHNASSDGTRTWVQGSDTRLDLYYKLLESSPIAKPMIRLSSQMPAPLEKYAVFFAVITIALGGWGVYFLIGRIGQTIFGSRLIPVSEYKAAQGRLGDPIGNALVLGPKVPNQMRLGSYHLIDFDTVMADDTWIDSVRADIAKARGASIALLNWDRHIESPSRNQQKLQLLRELLTEGRMVLIQSRIDPTHFDLVGDMDTNSEQTWIHALRSFSRWYPEEERRDVGEFEQSLGQQEEQALQNLSGESQEETRQAQAAIKAAAQVIREECYSTLGLQAIGSEVAAHLDLTRVTGGEVFETISRVTQSYYQQLWATCSWAEQYVLYALARDGFVCCTQPEVQHLLRRRLIAQTSMLGPFNATFRAWILEEGRDPIYAQAWGKSKPQQTWAKARHIVVVLLAALGLFLSVTQQEQVGPLMEFGTALAGIPIVGEWLGQLTGKKTSSAEKT